MAIVTGTSGNDKYPNEVKGTNLADQLFGLAGDDTLIGYGGNDTLEGGAGADELFGSEGFDYASYKGSPAKVIVDLGDFSASGGHAQGDLLYNIDGVIGSAYGDELNGTDQRNVLRGEGGADFLSGDGGNDRLEGGGGDDELGGGTGADELLGGTGVDEAYYGQSGAAVRVDLATGRGFGGDAEGDTLSGIEIVWGSGLNDRLAGNAAANSFVGSTGADTLSGAGSVDRFYYVEESDSTAAAADRILDFSRSQGDKIHLSYIDANAQVDGNQAFQFVGQKQFTGAGQLRFFQQNGDTVVEANTYDATAGAEMTIVLDPLVSLQATDFFL
jgi:Ca2+-binding RTX toxin-like protein